MRRTARETSDRRRRSSDQKPSVAGPLALLGLGLLVFIAVLGVWAFRSITEGGPEPTRCMVTDAGAAYRRSNLVGEPYQLQNAKVGDRYSSYSGCLPFDDGATPEP